MRINLVRVISYLFLAATVVVAFNVQDMPFNNVFSSPQKAAQSIEVPNTMTLLNEEYELVLLDRMSYLEKQRLDLIKRIETDNADDKNLALQAELKKLQEEQELLKVEITTVQRPVIVEAESQLVFAGEVEALRLQLKQKQDSIDEQEAVLELLMDEKDQQIAELQEKLAAYAAKDDQSDEFQTELSEIEKEIKLQKSLITEQSRQIQSLNAQLLNDKQKSENLQSRLSISELRSDELLSELGEKELQIVEIRSALASKTQQAEILAEELAAQSILVNSLQSESGGIIEKLFAASNIRGMFLSDNDAAKPQLIVNPNLIETALESPSVEVYHHDGSLVSKIIISDNNGVLQYRVFPGYPDPAEGNWF